MEMSNHKALKGHSEDFLPFQGWRFRICESGLLALLLLSSCEKEIEIDYHDMEPMYVVEGSISNLNASVRVSLTQPVVGVADDRGVVTDATVVLSMVNGQWSMFNGPLGPLGTLATNGTQEWTFLDTLSLRSDGYYLSRITGKAGNTYRLDVTVGGRHFTSTSVMQRQPVMNNMRFVWKKIFGQRMLFADLRLQDLPDETNYYYLHLFRNGVPYRSAVMRDRSNPGGELQQLFSLCVEDDLNSGDPNAKETLYEGDMLSLEIRTIDRQAYDYLFSLLSMNSSGTNPIANFDGGCLGYFSAFHQIVYNFTFREADCTEE